MFYQMDNTEEEIIRSTCYVCGHPRSAFYPLSIWQIPNTREPFFPFLENHEPPDGAKPASSSGIVLSCYVCFSYLTQQWELYEKDKVAHIKRIYFLKRVDNEPYTGVEMGMQSEYASQFLILANDSSTEAKQNIANRFCSPHLLENKIISDSTSASLSTCELMKPSPPSSVNSSINVLNSSLISADIQQNPLDLSTERSSMKRSEEISLEQHMPEPVSGVIVKQEVLDLSMPDKDASTEVCYICGRHHTKGTLMDIYAGMQKENEPYFPTLILHPRPEKSRPMEASGCIQGCEGCYRFLLKQWLQFESEKVPVKNRFYSFPELLSEPIKDFTFICSHCNAELPCSFLYIDAQTIKSVGQNSSVKSLLNSLPNKVCLNCSNELSTCRIRNKLPDDCCKDEKGLKKREAAQIDIDSFAEEKVSCYVCNLFQIVSQMKWISMVLEHSGPVGMFFPFLKYLPRTKKKYIVVDGKVLVCEPCYHHLSLQWTEYERESTPLDNRQFSRRNLSPKFALDKISVLSGSGSPAHSDASECSSNFLSGEEDKVIQVGLKVISSQDINSFLIELEVPLPFNNDDPCLPSITTQKPLNMSINCFICGFYSKPCQTYYLKNKGNFSEPFFPFLSKHVSANPEAKLDKTVYLVCFCCFHSMMYQWQKYEKMQVEQSARFYNTYNYICYICGLKTYRKRIRLLSVKDFPFLIMTHTPPVGGMVVNNGYSVVVCKDCHQSLSDQYTKLEGYGVPVERRQYNWMKRPAPPEFSCHSSPSISWVGENQTTLMSKNFPAGSVDSCSSGGKQIFKGCHSLLSGSAISKHLTDSRDFEAMQERVTFTPKRLCSKRDVEESRRSFGIKSRSSLAQILEQPNLVASVPLKSRNKKALFIKSQKGKRKVKEGVPFVAVTSSV